MPPELRILDTLRFARASLAGAVLLASCGSGDAPVAQPGPMRELRDDVPIGHVFQTADWEVLDRMVGINMPVRHITIPVGGYRMRKLTGPIATNEQQSPGCIEYGGFGATAIQTIEAKGQPGSRLTFLQGAGGC